MMECPLPRDLWHATHILQFTGQQLQAVSQGNDAAYLEPKHIKSLRMHIINVYDTAVLKALPGVCPLS